MGIIPLLLIVCLFFIEKITVTNLTIIFAALALFSILIGFSILRRSANQISDLAIKTGIVKSGGKSEFIYINDNEELNQIANNFNSLLRDVKEQGIKLMTYARDLTEAFEINHKEVELRNTLSRYVREDLVEKLINSGNGIFFENERKEVTILFADIRSFTSITERMAAENVVAMLNQFFGIMVDIIFKNNGVLDKFIGDKLMALFGFIPSDHPAPVDAIKAAMEMQNATENLMKVREKENKEKFEIGIAINTGIAIAGHVGSKNRIDYTVIGDCINVAARLEQKAKGGEIIIGEQTYRQIEDVFTIQKKGEMYAKNKTEPVKYYSVLRDESLLKAKR
ncbi:MAG: adenylate/guanylate cyclase domain-containing protein [bacterium]